MLAGRINSLKRKGNRGSVIVLVLVFVVLLTFIVVAFLEDATSKIKYYGLFHNRDDLRTDAYSALEITLAVINQYREVEGALWGPAQGWGDPLKKFGFKPRHAQEVRVSFEDESAKFGLQDLDYDSLLNLFEILGFDLPEQQTLADGLLDWTDDDDEHRLNGTDGEDYEDMDPPYRPANAPIETWDEFKLIVPFNTLFFDETGAPIPQWNQFREAVSLYHTGPLNINQASMTILSVLQETGALTNVPAFIDYKNGADGISGTEDDRLLRNNDLGLLSSESGIGTEIELLRVKVDAIRGDAAFTLEVMVQWSGSDASAAEARSEEDNQLRIVDPAERNANSARAQRRRARGNSRTAPSVAAELGYPFRFLRITENRKF